MKEEKNKKLGRGLSSLLSGKSFPQNESSSFLDAVNSEMYIGITKIIPNKNNACLRSRLFSKNKKFFKVCIK